MKKIGLLITAAGRGVRFGGPESKSFGVTISGRPMVVHTLCQFSGVARITEAIVTVLPEDGARLKALLANETLSFDYDVVVGGETRAASVYNGLKLFQDVDVVLIHDAARPYVSRDLILRVLKHVGECAVVPGIAVVDTIKRVEKGMVVETLPREALVSVQTPQLFSYSDLMAAYDQISVSDPRLTDEAMLMELAGFPVRVVAGEKENFKITFASDLALKA